MTDFFVMRERVNRFVREYETWFKIIARFIGMMFVFTYVNSSLGYFEALNSMMVNVLLSLICSIIPGSFTVFIVAVVITAHMARLSVILAALVVVVMLIVYLLFLKFAPGQSVVLLAVPVLMQYNLHFMVPVLAGVFFSPYAIVPATIGIFMVKFLGYTCEAVQYTGTGLSLELDNIAAALDSIITSVMDDKSIWLYGIVAAVTMAVVYIIRQFSFDYAFYVAIIAGGIAEIVAALIAGGIIGAETGIMGVIIGTLIGVLLALILQFLNCAVDYSRKEYLQFEDEDYYYYVKAIPKISVSEPEVNVVKVNAHRKKDEMPKGSGRTTGRTSKTE